MTCGVQQSDWERGCDRMRLFHGVTTLKQKVYNLKLSIIENFSHLPEGADEATVEAYLSYLIGVVFFFDKTSNRVQLLYLTLLDAPWEVISGYSLGSAALAYLYRRLCEASRKNVKKIAGPLIKFCGLKFHLLTQN
ncbi:protein MAIN-LIKE 2-like [Amaranthus tricolor]|uniref:protein MAIN-LIKE 2-like n=1 Tax=Amaranthus tricolor TaxID=29722 RepID=UPI002585703E|nr:protein MAIN-LIKE 2-like [Amaranthus tricolor]